MPIINCTDIAPGSLLKEDLYHLDSGKILLKKWELCTAEKLRLLKYLDINAVFKGVSAFEISEFLSTVNYKTIYADDLVVGQMFSAPIYDRNQRILMEANVAVNNSFLWLIAKVGGTAFRIKTASELKIKVYQEFLKKLVALSSADQAEIGSWEEDKILSKIANIPTIADYTKVKVATLVRVDIQKKKYEFDESVEMIEEGVKINSEYVDRNLSQSKKSLSAKRGLDAVNLEMGVKDPLVKRTESYKSSFYDTYLELIAEVSELFKNISENSKGRIDHQVKAICSRIVNTLIADKNLVINLTNLRSQDLDYLQQHSLNVAIYSINIGTAMGYSESQIFELTFGALLADLGFLKIDKKLLSKKNNLTPDERRTIEKHPSFSLDYLNHIKGIPASLPYIIYQSHEKLDGSGYPKGRPAFLVHDFAKIISIADMFDSLCTERPWRSALSPYKAMEEIIRLAGQKKLDGKIIRQWLFSISLFPVGSYVNLNDLSVAKVISANPSDFMRPNVRTMVKNGMNLSEPLTLVLGENKDLKITRAIPHRELQFSVLDGF